MGVETGMVEGGFKYNGRVYKAPKITENGFVAILANSRWNYFKKDEGGDEYIKFADSLKYLKNINDNECY